MSEKKNVTKSTRAPLSTRELQSRRLSPGPMFEVAEIKEIEDGFAYLPDETGGPAQITSLLGGNRVRDTVHYLNITHYDGYEAVFGELIWSKNDDEDIGFAILHSSIFGEDLRQLKYLDSFTSRVLKPLKTAECWGLTLEFVKNTFDQIEREDGPAGFVDFKPEFGRELPPSWIVEPSITRRADSRGLYDQNGFCGMIDIGQFSVFHRSSRTYSTKVTWDTKLHKHVLRRHDWRYSAEERHGKLAEDLLKPFFDEQIVEEVQSEFIKRVVSRLPRLWWSISETTIRNTVNFILQDQNGTGLRVVLVDNPDHRATQNSSTGDRNTFSTF
jgi:hypothetical protein